MTILKIIISVIAYLVLAPLIGGLLAGIDRKLSAHMQGRVGPPVLQPFYDVLKLLEKEKITVNNVQSFYVACFFVFVVITGCLFFAGQNILLVMFTLTLAGVFLIVGAFSANSPYAEVSAQREMLQMMAYEPMVLLACIGLYMQTGSFNVSEIVAADKMPILPLFGIFIGFIFILTIKFRKAPFDLAMSHHAHQELVGGLKTEFSGSTLALVEAAHWYENIMLLGMVFLFFGAGSVLSIIIGVVVCLVAYFFEVFIDNNFARMKWQVALNSAWVVALVLGGVNIFLLLVM